MKQFLMNILNYVVNGKGIGGKFMLILAVVLSFFYSVTVYRAGTILVPMAQDAADQILPIKIENGEVTTPENTRKTVYMQFGSPKDVLPITIDTRTDTLKTGNLRRGIYLSKKNLYVVNKNEVRIQELSGDVDLQPGDYRGAFKSAVNWTVGIFFVVALGMLFLMYLILAIFYTFCAQILGAIMSKKFDFDLRMRLSTICIFTATVLFTLLQIIGQVPGNLLYFIFVIALQTAFLKYLPSEEKPVAESKTQD